MLVPSTATRISPYILEFPTEAASGPYTGPHPFGREGRPNKCIFEPRDTEDSMMVVLSHDLATCTEADAASTPGGRVRRVRVRYPPLSLWIKKIPGDL